MANAAWLPVQPNGNGPLLLGPNTGAEKDRAWAPTAMQWALGPNIHDGIHGDRDCFDTWRGSGPIGHPGRAFYNRPDLLRAAARWPPGNDANGVLFPNGTIFHLRKTKAIDHPCDAVVIVTDGNGLINRDSTKKREAIEGYEQKAMGLGVAMPLVGALTTWNATIGPLPPRTARCIPTLGLNTNIPMYIQIHVEDINTAGLPIPGAAAAPIYQGAAPPPGPGNPPVWSRDLAMYRLRLCWYTALEEASDSGNTMIPGTMAAALGGAQGAPAAPAVINDIHSITFPLMGSAHALGYSFQEAADEACKALYEYFHMTLGSESCPVGLVAAAPGVAPGLTVEAERDARRAAFHDIYLTIPNGKSVFNPAVVGPARAPLNVFYKPMGQQEVAWQRAFMRYLLCDCCGRGID